MAFVFKGIRDYHRQLQSGQTTCTLAAQHYLEMVASHQHLNAMVAVFEEEVLTRAAHLDQLIANQQTLGVLHGIVVAIKDVLCYKDHPTTAGSAMLKDFHSLFTATAVQRLLDAGAIIIGTCNCDEYAMGSSNENSVYGAVKNAADITRVSGGSSGGSAVAVQAGLCMVSLGSDTGGSVRQPADFCGITGLKPTYGVISRYGLIAYASSFDCIGIFGNSAQDVGILYDVMAGPDPLDATATARIPQKMVSPPLTTQKRNYNFAYFEPTIALPGLDPEIKQRFLQLFETLVSQGHTVTSIPFPLLEYIVPTYYVLTTAEASSNLSRYDGIRYGHRKEGNLDDLTNFYKSNRTEGFGAEVQRRIMLGSFVLSAGYFDAFFGKAQQVRRLLSDQTKQVFSEFDALIMPVSPSTAFKIGEKTTDPIAMYLADIYTVFANLTGIPSMAIPYFSHSNGMPFGMQVMTNRSNEALLYDICTQFEDSKQSLQLNQNA